MRESVCEGVCASTSLTQLPQGAQRRFLLAATACARRAVASSALPPFFFALAASLLAVLGLFRGVGVAFFLLELAPAPLDRAARPPAVALVNVEDGLLMVTLKLVGALNLSPLRSRRQHEVSRQAPQS